ncbi:MAG: PBP1A family penicillin-binding protein [Erysipelotrichaceae bacterium]|nr:PBP1A family penicillin-binding protein [Erysipelotrichaceae bacterium]
MRIIKWIRRLVICIMILVMSIYVLGYIIEEPDLGDHQYIKLYDNQNNLYYSSSQSDNVTLEDVSHYFIDAIIAIEDHRFYEHKGFDIIGIVRAIKVNIFSDDLQGASTITQQYARLMYLTNEKTWNRKLNEAFLAIRLEMHYDKDTILEGYMNTVYFGHGIYGIRKAARYYFDKEPSELDLNEASMLAGVINGPEYYSPFNDEEAAKERQLLVLEAMVTYGYIEDVQASNAYETDFILNDNASKTIENSYPYFKDTVLNELEELGYLTDSYINQGLNVETSLDVSIQDTLEDTVNEQLEDKNELEVASMIVDHDAHILALIGGADYTSSQFNRATSSSRQIGSTMKPLLYYVALENGFTPITKFKSEETTFQLENGETYSPSNFNDKYAHDDITLAQAIAVSDNIYAVKTHLFLGENALVSLLNQFGYTDISPNPSLALGTLNTNIYDLSSAYVTISNEGIYNDIHTITKITNDNGEILYEYIPTNKQLLNQDICLVLSQLLTSPFHEEFSTYASATMANYQVNSTFAVKTGTTAYDSLCIGYNPNYTILSWCGYDDNREMTLQTQTRIPKIIFQTMANYLQEDDIWYEPTDSIEQVPINPLTGEYDENGMIYWFKK